MPGPGGRHGGGLGGPGGGFGGPGRGPGGPGGPRPGWGHRPMMGGWGHRPPPPHHGRGGGCCGCLLPVIGIAAVAIAAVIMLIL